MRIPEFSRNFEEKSKIVYKTKFESHIKYAVVVSFTYNICDTQQMN